MATQFFAHPESEEKYIQCSMFGQMFVFTCPLDLVWIQSLMACDHKSLTSMFSVTTPSPSSSSNPGIPIELNQFYVSTYIYL